MSDPPHREIRGEVSGGGGCTGGSGGGGGGEDENQLVLRRGDGSSSRMQNFSGDDFSDRTEAVRWITSCGSPCADVELIIVDPETRTRMPDSAIGEIWIRSQSVADG